MSSALLYTVIISASFLGGLLQTLCGFGGGVVLLLALSPFYGLLTAPALSLAICIFMVAFLTVRFRRDIEWKLVILPTVAYLVTGTIINRLISKDMNTDIIGFFFGVFQILLSVYYLFIAKKVRAKPSILTGILCGGISGITGSLFGIGGPMLAVYLIAASKDKQSFAANIQSIFLVTNAILLIGKLRNGFYTAACIAPTFAGGIAILLGTLLGIRFMQKLDAEKMKKIVYMFLGVSGIITVCQYIGCFFA